MTGIRILLLPFSALFRIVVFVRNKLYDLNYLRISELNSTVISIGNVSSGGTGKTPMVEYIADYFIKKGKSVNIILKGYKRIYEDLQVAEFGYMDSESKLSSENFGDEGLMLLESLPETTPGRGLLIISDKKLSGAKFSDNKFKPDVIIIDDGFQLRKLSRDLDIVMVNPYESKHLLPAGNMREPYKNVRRADIVAINHKFRTDPSLLHKGNLSKVVNCFYEFGHFKNARNEMMSPERSLKAVAFCGIAAPESYKDLLRKQNITLTDFIPYPDHHSFKAQDIRDIIAKYNESGAEYILTTQKDYVRIRYSNSKREDFQQIKNEILFNYPLYYAKIKLQISQNEEYLFDKLEELIRKMP